MRRRSSSCALSLSLACAAIAPMMVACDDGPHGSLQLDAGPPDAPRTSFFIVSVSPDGNDEHDGISLPVETLKRAVEIATANPDVSDIVLAAGRYTTRQGEMFPYKLPATLVGISGAPGGGSVLVGTGTQDGLSLASAQLQDLALESFTTAIDSHGTVRIKNLRITGSATGIRAQTGTLRIDGLEISGVAGSTSCATGLELNDVADLTLTGFTTSDIAPAVHAYNSGQTPGVIDIASAMITLSPETTCAPPSVIDVNNATFRLSNSTLDGALVGNGGDRNAISLFNRHLSQTVMATLTGTALRRWNIGVQITATVARIEHSEISDCGAGLTGSGGSTSLEDVTMMRNSVGLLIGPFIPAPSGTLTMRNSRILDSAQRGVDLTSPGSADLGTPGQPGNNTLKSATGAGLKIQGPTPTQINAVGNTWMPNIQGADAVGRYPERQTVVGPIDGNNFALESGWSLQL